jgi:hypothetical protein
VRNKETGREGKITAGLITSVGEVTYSIAYDSGLREEQKPAARLEAAESMAMGEDDVRELEKLDVLGQIVYLRVSSGLGDYLNEDARRERKKLYGRPAQVVAIRTPGVETEQGNLVTSSGLRLTLKFFLDDEMPMTDFRIDDVTLTEPVNERLEVARVSF